MQTKKNDNAFPMQCDGEDEDGTILYEFGLSKREYFAAAALQGIVANSSLNWEDNYKPDEVAHAAVELAEFLIISLNKTNIDE